MQTKVFDIEPQPAPRMNAKSKHGPRAQRYFAYRDDLVKLGIGVQPWDAFIFCITMPKSWSDKKRREYRHTPHQTRNGPDYDNLLKAVMDAAESNDSHLWAFGPQGKIWANRGRIIRLRPNANERQDFDRAIILAARSTSQTGDILP